VGVRLRDCTECGAPVGYRDRVHCWRCHQRISKDNAASVCPGCGQDRILQPGTGRCASCSRTCPVCGAVVRMEGRTRCYRCQRRHERQQARRTCPRCGRPGYLREETGWCGNCSRPAPVKNPPRACAQCGQLRRHAAFGLCGPCWQRHPDRPFVRVGSLISALEQAPEWLPDFAAHVAAGFCPARASRLISDLGKLLSDGGPVHPQALLERSRQFGRGRSPGTLARALESFFLARGLALAGDEAARRAAGRRQHRVDAVPGPLRAAVAGFANASLKARARARLAGTRPRSDATIEANLSILRFLACFLVERRSKTDWAAVDVHDIEAFLQIRPASRKRRLTALGHFFRWARSQHLLLVDPTRGLHGRAPRAFSGNVLTLVEQRQLFRRWTGDLSVHPHEALTGLLALLHGASRREIRQLTVAAVDTGARAVQLAARPGATPLDPATWAALQRCLTHHAGLRTANPHLLVTKQTKSTRAPASEYYVSHVLDAAGIRPRVLRSTRLADLAARSDPKLVAAAFGMDPEGVIFYLADHVDDGRLASRSALAEGPR
jgi:site-specific recombinase XerD